MSEQTYYIVCVCVCVREIESEVHFGFLFHLNALLYQLHCCLSKLCGMMALYMVM